MTEVHKPLPIPGYTDQASNSIAMVTANKHLEERILRLLDRYAAETAIDPRWLQIGRTHIEQGFMAINRAVMKPTRVPLPEDNQQSPA